MLTIYKSTERIEKLGAKTVLPKTAEGKNGWYSNLVDIEGNRFGLYQLVTGTKGDSLPVH